MTLLFIFSIRTRRKMRKNRLLLRQTWHYSKLTTGKMHPLSETVLSTAHLQILTPVNITVWVNYTSIPLLPEPGIGGRTLKHKSHTLSPKFCDWCPGTFPCDLLAQSKMRFSRASPRTPLKPWCFVDEFPWAVDSWGEFTWSLVAPTPLPPFETLYPFNSDVGRQPPSWPATVVPPHSRPKGPWEGNVYFREEAACCGSGVTCHCGHLDPDRVFPLN